MLDLTLRRRAHQFTKLIRHSAIQPRRGQSRKPVLVNHGELALTFIGHSAFFMQIGGKNVLVDPNFAQWLFVLKRLRRPGLRIPELPPIDYVLVTHAHFDHLHRPSLRRIARTTRYLTGQTPTVIVPRHVGDLVRPLGFRNVIELNWWQEFADGGFSVTHVPSRHWGARVLHDTHRGYGGFVIRDGEQSVYHAGDTAYFPGFAEIGERLAPKIALLPVGAYHPESFRKVHTSPEDAIQAFLDLGSQWMIPMHYGTFRLTHEPIDEPIERLHTAAERAGASRNVLVLEEGVTTVFR